jgi:hypothetical protein
MENGALGKKIFFLYPPPVLTEVVDLLARQEFEVYLAYNHERLKVAIASFPDALVFINLDDGLDEKGWLDYVEALRKDCPAVGVGIITLNDNPELREHYLMNIQVQCGFVVLKIGAAKTADILAKTLEANEARGRRKFVRAYCSPGIGQCAVDHDGTTLRASLSDLSSAGMAICFEGDRSLKVGTVLRDMALVIKGQRLLASGVIVAERSGDESIHVVMFDPGSLDETKRDKLKSLVFKINQATMDLVLEKGLPAPRNAE